MSGDELNPLLAEALDAHGGLAGWRRFRGLSSTIVTGGSLWAIKGVDMDATPRRATTEFLEQRTAITPFGNPDWTMMWRPEQVAILDSAGQPIAERESPREAFVSHQYDTPWDPLHLAYFNGYAMWTYHAVPFILSEPGYVVSDLAPIQDEGQTLRGLGVRFPAGVHTHSQTQRFYFDETGLLRRHDYRVDVWANTAAAHYLSDYVAVDSMQLPTRRSVFPMNADGSLRRDLNLVTVDLSNYAFH